MKKRNTRLFTALCALLSFCGWTIAVKYADVRPIGPNGSSVGLATLNGFFHSLTGELEILYILTDLFGLIPLAIAFAYAVLGFVQLVRGRCIRSVDRSILCLGVIYAITVLVFVIFEIDAVNYRPVLIEGVLEVSYPSSTTMLVGVIIPTAMIDIKGRMRSGNIRRLIICTLALFMLFMIIGRIISGVHWISDIIGGALISSAIVLFYSFILSVRD